jgi:hypothetical protein
MPVANQSILFMIIGITMFMCLVIVIMVTSKERGGAVMTVITMVDMIGAATVGAMAGVMTGTKLL